MNEEIQNNQTITEKPNSDEIINNDSEYSGNSDEETQTKLSQKETDEITDILYPSKKPAKKQVSRHLMPTKLPFARQKRNYHKFQILLTRFYSFSKLFLYVFTFFMIIFIIKSNFWYLPQDVFKNFPNKYIEIEGNSIITSNQLLMKLGRLENPNKPMFLLNTSFLEKTLYEMSPVKKIYVRRFWLPAKLKIVIEEKRPILSISPSPSANPIAVFTDDISIIDRNYLPLPANKKTFTVLTYEDFYQWTSQHVKYLVYLSKLLETYSGEEFGYLDIRNPDDVFVQLQSVKLRLGELNTTVFNRVKRVSSVLPQIKDLKEDIDYIDLRWDNSTFIKLNNKSEKISL
ncbi:MAG: FtsQ-type POTRA domain-containing protein [Candidatus Gastranaerophilales bacterium]|nr:FtsQ-type POTRA domain-containing protein [Candidatus Gastranaerophilales bacterium]